MLVYSTNNREIDKLLKRYGLTKKDVRDVEEVIEIDKDDVSPLPLEEGDGIKHFPGVVSVDLKKLAKKVGGGISLDGIYRISRTKFMEIKYTSAFGTLPYKSMEPPYHTILFYEMLSERNGKVLMKPTITIMIPPITDS